MKADDICRQAAILVSGDRQAQYGSPAENLGHTARLWSAYLGVHVTAADVAAMMILLKVSRARHAILNEIPSTDTPIDAGYAGLLGELMG